MDKRKRDYLAIKVRGKIVKVDPDIHYKIISCRHEPPYRKYNNIKALTINDGYAYIMFKEKGRKAVSLSRFIMNAKKGEFVDHINRTKLDNRRKNLRIVDQRQNCLNKILKNKSGFTGVAISSKKNCYYAAARFMTKEGKRLYKSFKDTAANRVLAAFARDKFVLQAGEEEYANLNFPCWKFEPFKSILLAEDLSKYKERSKEGNKETLRQVG